MVVRRDEEEDMTMEEILASIRRYVADEKPAVPERTKIPEDPQFSPGGPTITGIMALDSSPERNAVLSQSSGTEEPIFELTDLVEEEAPLSSPSQSMPQSPLHIFPQSGINLPETSAILSSAKEQEMHKDQPTLDDSMTSSRTRQASLSALSRLAEIGKVDRADPAKSPLTLDKLIADLARPMIKEWLEKNLSTVVERMVAREIDRITRELQR